MGTIYYGCKNCEEHNPEGSCFPRDMVRVMPAGEWICENCYDDAPSWTYVPLLDDDDSDEPRWHDFPEVPEHVPASSISRPPSGGAA